MNILNKSESFVGSRIVPPHKVGRPLIMFVAACICLSICALASIPIVYADDPIFVNRHTYGTGSDYTRSVLMADMDGDGDLDLVVASDYKSFVYLNDGTGNFTKAHPFGTDVDRTYGVAVGDMDGNGSLDIVAGNFSGDSVLGRPDMVYLNDGAGNFYSGLVDCNAPPTNVRCFGPGNDHTASVAVGDMNGDGQLDIIAGNWGWPDDNGRIVYEQNRVYLNNGGKFVYDPGMTCTTIAVVCFGTGLDPTVSVAVGYMNGDERLDIVTGNDGQQSVVYFNDGASLPSFTSSQNFGSAGDTTSSVAVNDMNGDGKFDIIVGKGYGQNVVYLNNGADLPSFTTGRNFGTAGTNSTNSVAVGDLNGDGALDIVAGNNGQSVVYFNDGANSPSFTRSRYFGTGSENTYGAAIGDLDGNGALDIVLGDFGAQNALYLNDGAGDFITNQPFGTGTDATKSVAVGDLNGDNYLDLVVGNNGEQNVVYLNNSAGTPTFATTVNFGTGTDATSSVAVADMTGDGALDLVVGNYKQQNVIYVNDGANPPGFSDARNFGPSNDATQSITTGDVNGDGYLDVVVGNEGQGVVYLNDGRGKFYPGPVTCGVTDLDHVHCFGPASADTRSIALGDVNGDGALDIVVGNDYQTDVIYLNDRSGNFYSSPVICGVTDPARALCFGTYPYAFSTGVAVGDVNRDGALDIIVGTMGQISFVALNDGKGNFPYTSINCGITAGIHCFGSGAGQTYGVTAGDIDGDRDLDLVAINNKGFSSEVYVNDGSGNFPTRRRFGKVSDLTTSVALGDLDRDGTLDLVAGNDGQQNAIYFNRQVKFARSMNNPPWLTVTRPGTRDANLYSTPLILASRTIPIPYTLFDPEGDPVRAISATFSLNGGGEWYTAFEASDSVPQDLSAFSGGVIPVQHTFQWDTYASGFFGQSDNVVIRLEAYPSLTSGRNGVPVFQRPYASATTFPFRVRGTQVRVLSSTQYISNALVYRLPAGQTVGAQPIADNSGVPFRTDGQGYLQGRGRIVQDDRLVALYPITSTDAYILYHTSATPTLTGLIMYPVTRTGVQTLTVSAANPLILFNLDVSLEWDARQDATTLTRLQYDLQRASELLYDWTNGQAALGHVNLYQARDHWNDANVRIFANNRLRPNASQGGIVSGTLSEIITTSLSSTQVITYEPGQIRMAVNWNRYGDPGGVVGDDWARAFAHELGHYLLFQDDDYLGYDDAGNVVSVPNCPSAMSDPYSADKKNGYDEFHLSVNWTSRCANTLANRETRRSDWQTLTRFYPALTETAATMEGPGSLPLAVTQIDPEPITTTNLITPLLSPVYSLLAEGGSYAPQRASAYLFQHITQDGLNDRLVELGSPVSGKVEARGARAGDRLCVFVPDESRLGCAVLDNVNRTLKLTSRPDWSPSVLVTPITSRTIQVAVISVTQPVTMQAQLFPRDGDASAVIPMTRTGMLDPYIGKFDLPSEALEASIHVWTDEGGETVTSYSIGGNPVPRRPGSRNRHYPPRRWRRAPVLSSDGQAQILGIKGDFPLGEFYALQTVENFPAPPSWTTVVGQAYRLVRSTGAPTLTGTSLVVNYLESEVPPGEEPSLTIYFRPTCGSGEVEQPTQICNPTWRALPTTPPEGDLVSAPTQGEGLYLILSSIDVPLQPGWNNVSYPVAVSRPVTIALASIAGKYTSVCSYQSADVDNPWHCFGSGTPPFAGSWVNDLTTLDFGTYWIYATATQDVTLSLKGPYGGGAVASRLTPPPGPTPAPPQPGQCRYYHTVRPGENLFRISLAYGVPMSVIAYANGIFNNNLIYAWQTLCIP